MLHIRSEIIADIPAIHALIAAAFEREDEAMLVDLLRAGDAFIPELSLVAEEDGGVTGHILFTRIRIEHPDGQSFPSLALAPVAVQPGRQRKGVGGELIRQGLQRAMEMGYGSVIVLGRPEYYSRFGFTPAIHRDIRAPFKVPVEAFMAIELIPNGLQNISGIVRYDPAFEQVG